MTTRVKVRTGCLTCKARHIKCDEQKPVCRRCTSAKIVCEGYAALPQSLSSAVQLSNDEERRGFLYFRARTMRKIFGQRDGAEWISYLLQLGHASIPIKHAIVALASLHESTEPADPITCLHGPQKPNDNASHIVALRHYNKAIRSLGDKPMDAPEQPDVVMILCILFMCLEQFRSNDSACITHLLAGLKLVNWWRSLTSNYAKLRNYSKPTIDFINSRVLPILQRIRVQFALCMDLRHELGNAVDLPYFPPPSVPPSYATLDAARTGFDRIMNYAFSALQNNPAGQLTQEVESLLNKWKSASNISDTCAQTSALQRYTRELLSLYYHVSIIIVGTYNTKTETSFDGYIEQFRLITRLAESLVQHWKASTQEYGLLFSFDLGITPPMFFVASRCRDFEVRRKAVDLLLHSPCYHGVWQDRYSGLCAQRIVELEEMGLQDTGNGPHLPESRRVRKVSADFDDENHRIVLKYMYSPITPDSTVCTTLIKLDK